MLCDMVLSRRLWIGGVGAAAITAVCRDIRAADATPTTQPAKKKIDKGPPIEPALVKQFVGVGHGDLDGVKQMLAERPSIVNATWDWGGGDFETALGGASHMGRADIAQYLLDHNARMDLFAAAVLNKLEIIKFAVASFPGIQKVPGPHGIPLIAHAKRGGAEDVVKFLESLG